MADSKVVALGVLAVLGLGMVFAARRSEGAYWRGSPADGTIHRSDGQVSSHMYRGFGMHSTVVVDEGKSGWSVFTLPESPGGSQESPDPFFQGGLADFGTALPAAKAWVDSYVDGGGYVPAPGEGAPG